MESEPVSYTHLPFFDKKCGIIVDVKIVKKGMNYTCYQNLKQQRHFFTRPVSYTHLERSDQAFPFYKYHQVVQVF